MIDATPARAATHLNVLRRAGRPVRLAVPLADGGEEDGARGHVEPHGECLCREEQPHEALLEQDLDHLSQHRQHAGVVHRDATLEQWQQHLNLA